MSNYTKSTNFATKDNLSPGNPLKIVKGTEIDTEYNNIQTAVATKTDNSAAAITGGSITGITDLAVADGGTGASTATAALNNLLPTQTGNANKYLQTDGTNATWDAVSLSTSDITGTLPVANGGTGVTTSTGTGAVVLSNSPTLVTPALGTPASGTATNLTGLPISTGVSGLGTGVATFLGTPSSANLASAVTDETGSGALVFANSPTLVTPALGTPSALVGTNITGTASGLTAGNVTTNANLTGAVTSVGNATSLGSFSSANLLAALTDETGTGSAVFATSPTLVTPILGTPTSATLTNATGLPISTGVSGLGTGVATALAVNVGSSGAPLVNGGVLGTPSSGTATNLTGLPLSTGVTGTLAVANGGTGTATPSIVAGTNVTVTGTWPNQTIASTAGGSGTVTSVDVSGGTTGLTTSGGPVTSSGTVTLAGTLAVANGGTGQTSYTDGQLLIGNSTGNTLTKATLTAGTNVTITNAAGAITIAASGGGASAATPTTEGTVYGKTNTTNLTFLGYGAGTSNTGTYNTFVGGKDDYYGISAGGSNTSGGNNTAVGSGSIAKNVTGSNITSVGMNAGQNTTAGPNSYFGLGAGSGNTSGTGNVAVGYRTLGYTGAGGIMSNNVCVGDSSMTYNTTGGQNVAVGRNALLSNTTSSNNVAIGYSASEGGTLSYNVAVGTQALYTGGNNDNVAIGYQALYTEGNTGNGQNVAIGSGASKVSLASAYNNVCVGYRAAFAQTSGGGNTIIGSVAAANLTTATSVTIVGNSAGASLTTGTGGTYIGGSATASSGTVNSEIVLCTGNGPTGKGASTGFISPNGGGVYQGNNSSSWSTTSDQRLKKNIVDNTIGLSAINSIRVRNFEYRVESEITELPTHAAIKKEGVQLGVIAQELQAVLPECVKQESTGVLSVDTDNLTWYMINAIKELKAELDAYKASHP